MPTLASVAGQPPRRDDSTRTYGILSSFPPTPCGIATFSAALASGLVSTGARVDVVRCDAAPSMEDPLVVAGLRSGRPSAVADAVDALNRTDVVIVQHEYGLYTGADGSGVLNLMSAISAPTIVVAHTVVHAPSPNQRRVLESVCDAADVVVVMTDAARTRLVDGFDVQPAKVVTIPHGAAVSPEPRTPEAPSTTVRRPRLLTWGLLGPGKGIEWAIDAVAELSDLSPRPDYTVAGATHPKVHASSGESYREMLARRAGDAGVSRWVTFDDRYRTLDELAALIRSADLVVLPYDSDDQVTSGVLVDAVAAGRPVVSTAFPHAVELLASGAGIVVEQRSGPALAAAIRSVLTDPGRAESMAAEARRLAPDVAWPAVARRYDDLAAGLVSPALAVRT